MLPNRHAFALGHPAPMTPERQVKNTPPPHLSGDELDAIFDIIISVYGNARNRPFLCKDAGVTSRTGQHWMLRTHAPRILHVFRMMRKRPEFKSAIVALINRL